MIRYLSGVSNADIHPRLAELGVGILCRPGNSLHRWADTAPAWAADNGAYSRGARAPDFDCDAWHVWLRRTLAEIPATARASCLFVAVPDAIDVSADGRTVRGDASETMRRFLAWAPAVRELGMPAAFVGQPGSEDQKLPWYLIDYVFLGGHDAWKLGDGAAKLTRRARAHGVPVHMGRVNSRRRLLYAQAIGCASADGTYLAFGPKANLPKLASWLAACRQDARLTGTIDLACKG